MAVTVIRNATLHVTSEEFVDVSAFAISDRKIVPFSPSLLEDGTAEEIDFQGLHVAPGLIDLLINGCNGVSFAQTPTVETLEHMRRYLALDIWKVLCLLSWSDRRQDHTFRPRIWGKIPDWERTDRL